MRFTVEGRPVYASTGGRAHETGRPWIVFLHGAGASHHVWVLQGRAIAHDGWNVLAPDLPGHHLSGGEPKGNVAELAKWLIGLMDAAGCDRAVVAGHSLGGLVALDAAVLAPERVEALVLVSTAAAITVNPALIETAQKNPEKAYEQMTSWSYGPAAHLHENTWPGGSHLNFGRQLLRTNGGGVLVQDLKTCAAYKDGMARAAAIAKPCLCVFAGLDRMTPVKNGLALAAALKNSKTIVVDGAGHTLPTERPRELNLEIRRFLAALHAGARHAAEA